MCVYVCICSCVSICVSGQKYFWPESFLVYVFWSQILVLICVWVSWLASLVQKNFVLILFGLNFFVQTIFKFVCVWSNDFVNIYV